MRRFSSVLSQHRNRLLTLCGTQKNILSVDLTKKIGIVLIHTVWHPFNLAHVPFGGVCGGPWLLGVDGLSDFSPVGGPVCTCLRDVPALLLLGGPGVRCHQLSVCRTRVG